VTRIWEESCAVPAESLGNLYLGRIEEYDFERLSQDLLANRAYTTKPRRSQSVRDETSGMSELAGDGVESPRQS